MKGTCLCGAVTLTAPEQREINVCHCSMCRRWSGGPMLAVHCGADVRIEGEVKTYRSSDWAQRGFCPHCGTHLFYHLLPADDDILPAGLFQPHAFAMTAQIFIDEKPDYDAFANDTPIMTGEQVFATFGQ